MDVSGVPNDLAASSKINTMDHTESSKQSGHMPTNSTFPTPYVNIESFQYRSYILPPTTHFQAKYGRLPYQLLSMTKKNGKWKKFWIVDEYGGNYSIW
jgi:hypothetical protein